MQRMQGIHPGIVIRPFAECGSLLQDSSGWGIFMKCRFGQMQIGAVLPCGEAQYLLNIMILPEMEIAEYVPCDFSDVYESFEAAEEAVCNFLEANRR